MILDLDESATRSCELDGCDGRAQTRSMCLTHYARWRIGDRGEKLARPLVRREAAPANRVCSVDGCGKSFLANRLCQMHYTRLRETGQLGGAEPLKRGPRSCKVIACTNRAVTSDDLCPTHRRRKRLYGDEHGKFELTKPCVVEGCGTVARPAARSDEYCGDHYLPWIRAELAAGRTVGHVGPGGYLISSVYKRNYPDHRLVMEHLLGRELLPDENVHHKNGQRADNRPENLELWVTSQPCGQRVEDKVVFALEILRRYEPGRLAP